jgi:uroporphyrinogen-III synthase
MTRPVVLNTRPREQAAELGSLLRAAGCAVLEVPAIDVVRAWDATQLQLVRDTTYAWLVLTSQNAARFLAEGLGGQLPAARVLCGRATARALALDAALTLERFSAAAALDALRPLLRYGERVLVPRALEGRDELIDGLAELGIQVDAPVCYRTLARAHAFASLGHIDVVTLCSPSAVRAVADGLGHARLRALRVVCLGGSTAAVAQAAGVRVDAIAAETSMPSLVAAVMSVVEVTV